MNIITAAAIRLKVLLLPITNLLIDSFICFSPLCPKLFYYSFLSAKPLMACTQPRREVGACAALDALDRDCVCR
jgi:hypothetical protein